MKETRFRDILTCESSWEILRKVLKKTFQHYGIDINLKGLKVIAKEFPLIRDKVGYQLRYIDVLAINETNDLFIIELKSNYNNKTNMKNILSQVNEYENLIKENLIDIQNHEKFLSIFHFYQIEIFNFMNISMKNISSLYKVILFMKSSEPIDHSKNADVFIGTFYDKEMSLLSQDYINFQINRINEITPGFEELLHQNCYINYIGGPKFRPIPLTAYDNSDLPMFRFESLDSNSIKKIKIKKDQLNQSWELPKLFPIKSKNISNEDFLKHLTEGEYYIQIFRSGRANPIIYIQYDNEEFFPFHQIKSRLFKKNVLVNKKIALDASGLTAEMNKKTIFEEVIMFDMGSFKAQKINENGVKFTQIHLDGIRYDITFELIGPKIRTDLSLLSHKHTSEGKKIPPLLPFMESNMINKQIKNYEDLFEINPFTDDWITTNLRITPKN